MSHTKQPLLCVAIVSGLLSFSSGTMETVSVGAALRDAGDLMHEAPEPGPYHRGRIIGESSTRSLSAQNFGEFDPQEGHAQVALSQSQLDGGDVEEVSIDPSVLIFQSRELSVLIDYHQSKLERTLRTLEIEHPDPAQRPRPPLETKEQKLKMVAVVDDATNGLRYATQVIQLVSAQKYLAARKAAMKARFALRSAFNAQYRWVDSGYYIRLHEENANYRIRYREYLEHTITRDRAIRRALNAEFLTETQAAERAQDETHDLSMRMIKVHNKIDSFHLRLQTSQATKGLMVDQSRISSTAQRVRDAINQVMVHAVTSFRLQSAAIKELFAKNRVKAYALLDQARQELEEMYGAYAEKLSQGHGDKQILDDQLYRQERRALAALTDKLKSRKDLDWEIFENDTDYKRQQLIQDFGSWFKADQESLAQLRFASRATESLDNSSKSAQQTYEHLPQSSTKEPKKVIDSLVKGIIFERQSIVEAHRAARELQWSEAAKRLRRAQIQQKSLHAMRLTRIKKGLPDLDVDMNPAFQELTERYAELQETFKRGGLALAESRDDAIDSVIIELDVMFLMMEDISSMLESAKGNDLRSQLLDFPASWFMSENKNKYPEFSTSEEELKYSQEQVQEAIELMNEAIRKIGSEEIAEAMELVKKASHAQEKADSWRIHRVLQGLSDDVSREDLTYQEVAKAIRRVVKKLNI